MIAVFKHLFVKGTEDSHTIRVHAKSIMNDIYYQFYLRLAVHKEHGKSKSVDRPHNQPFLLLLRNGLQRN